MKKIGVLLLSLLLTACAPQAVKEHQAMVNRDAAQAEAITQEALAAQPSQAVVYRQKKGIWLGGKAVPVSPEEALPPVFGRRWVFQFPDRANLPTIAERITRIAGVPIQIRPDVFVTAASMMPSGAAATETETSAATSTAATSMAYSSVSSSDYDRSLVLNYDGELKGLLDLIATKAGVSWKYENGQVIFFRFMTKRFLVKALPGTTEASARVGRTASATSGAEGGDVTTSSGSFQSQSEASSAISLSFWTGIEQGVQAMLSPLGKMAISQSTGTVTVTDTKDAVEKIGDFIDTENRLANRQVTIKVEIISVATSNNESFGLDWNLVYNRISELGGKSWNLTLGTPETLVAGRAASAMYSILTNDPDQAVKFEGSNLLFKILSEQGAARIDRRVILPATHNQPTPFSLTDQISYLARTEAATGTDGGTGTPGLTPGQITTGFILNIVPTIQDDSSVLMQISIDSSELIALDRATSGGQTIETPRTSGQSSLYRLKLRQGETMILPFEQVRRDYDRRGLSQRSGIGLGGSFEGNGRRDTVLVLITPLQIEGSV